MFRDFNEPPGEPEYVGLTKEIINQGYSSEYAPKNWDIIYNGILKMRTDKKHIGYNADVDNIGCASLIDTKADIKTQRFHVLVGLLLSSQTKDVITAQCVINLKQQFNGLTIKDIIKDIDILNENVGDTKNYKNRINEINKAIESCGFHNKKSKYLLDTCIILGTKYDYDIPNTVKELCKLPGIGPKMGYIAMQVAWKSNAGIGVDVHCHRICNSRIMFTNGKCKKPDDTRKYLESWIPKELWPGFNRLIVGFGQNVCKPKKPLCSHCIINNVCPFTNKNLD